MSTLLNTLKRFPDASVFAGGTYLLWKQEKKYPNLPRRLVLLDQVEDLHRINRTERYIEIGAGATLSRILAIGANTIPPVLFNALKSIGHSPLRNLATLGGNICVADQRMTAFPVLLALDSRVELRKAGQARWEPMGKLLGPEGNLLITKGEVLTRIRVPFSELNIQVYKKISGGPESCSLSFCAVAENNKGTLSDFRFAFGSLGKAILRSREIEAELIGRKFPLPERDIDGVIEAFKQYLLSLVIPLSPCRQSLATKLLRWFLIQIDEA